MAGTPCFIHIGAPKTGSTFLQRVFYENRRELGRRGVLYPEVSLRGFGHHDIAFLLSGGYPEWATPQPRPLDELATELAAACARHSGPVLLSSEIFYLFPNPEKLVGLLETTGVLAQREPRIVVYLRRQDDAHESWYNQRVKAQGETGSIQESIERYDALWDYGRQLAVWSSAFGDDALIVKRYNSTADQSNLIGDFFAIMGLSDLQARLPPDHINARENRDILSFQRELNRLPLSPQEKRRFHRELMVLSERTKGRGIFDERPLLEPKERVAILRRYAESNAAVAKRYFAGEPLFPPLPDADALSSTPCGTVETGLTDKKMAYILTWLLEYTRPN
jgi:hypothetical protein